MFEFGPIRVKHAAVFQPVIRSIQAAQAGIDRLPPEKRGELHWYVAASALPTAHESQEAADHAVRALRNALKTEGWLIDDG
jgi:hypothetical protein